MNELMMNTNSIEMSEQHQLISALAEIFDGSSVRYFIKENNTIWFVCKDVVEAVGGKWDGATFRRAVGDGAVTNTPITDSMGRPQDVIVAPHKTILKWLTLSRLPKADTFSDLVWNIMDKVFRGETINTASNKQEVIKLWNDTIAMVQDGRKWGYKFIKLLEECEKPIDGKDPRQRYSDMLNRFFREFNGNYDTKKDVIEKMRKNFQSYKDEYLSRGGKRNLAMDNILMIDVERELENIWAKFEAHARGQSKRIDYTKKKSISSKKLVDFNG